MSFVTKEDKELSKRASGLPDKQRHLGPWKSPNPTPIISPTNSRTGTRNQKSQNPFNKGRFKDDINARTGKASSGNPNSRASVFTPNVHKRPKTQSTSASTEWIDITTDDAEPVSRGSVAADDSDDSLLLGLEKRIAKDGPATRRLNERRDTGPSNVIHSDTEPDAIEGFLETSKKPVGTVQDKIRFFNSQNGTPKLQLNSSNPLKHLRPEKPKSKPKLNKFATDPTIFTHGKKSKGKEVPVLSLMDWIRGAERFPRLRDHFLSWEVQHNNPVLKLVSAKGRSESTFNMKSGIEGLQASSKGVSPLIVKFNVRSSLQSDSNDTVAFLVDTNDESCNELARNALHEFLKQKCGCKGWLDPSGARAAWDAAVQELDYLISESRERQLSLNKIPTTDSRNERHSSESSHSELPPSIDLTPPPKGKILPKTGTSQMVGRMGPRLIAHEQREARETAKDEPIAGPSNQTLRRSSRRSTIDSGVSEVGPTRASPLEDPDELLLVYRPFGTGAVNITRGDFERLQPGKYLNDTLIEFGLKLWLSDLRDCSPELANQIHLFSSFFYKKLAIKDKKAGYESVRKWTSKVDLFSKKYLVVPINEHLHWYLAIIYQPEYALRPAQPPPSPLTRKRKRDEGLSVEPSERRETPNIPSNSTSKATTETPEGGETEIIPDSEPSSPKMELEEQTQTDDTNKPEEREVERQLCVDVGSVSLGEREEPLSLNGEQDYSALVSHADEEGMEIDGSPPASPMPVDREVHIEEVEPFVRVDDNAPEAPAVVMEDSFNPDTISVEGFYGSGPIPSKTYSKKKSRASSPGKLERGDLDTGVGTTPPKTDRTYIFVFDSLNGKHPGAMRNLAQYLRFEAMDKKGIENPDSPETMAAHVPTQDNYCDCGLYLLHFAKVFMEDPAKSFHTILTKRKPPKAERDVDWKKESVGTSREDFTERILNLSGEWFKERAKEAEEKAKAKEREGTSKPDSIAVDSPEESDDDVIFEEVITLKPKKLAAKRPEASKKGPAGRGVGRVTPNAETGPAEPKETNAVRLR